MALSRFFNIANMSFNTIRENKILAKISDFTVVEIDEDTASKIRL